MGFNPRLAPYTFSCVMDADPAADCEFNAFRFPVKGQVVGVTVCNDAAIATATNTLLLAVGKSAAGTGTFATIASKAAGDTKAADTPYALTLTSAASTMAFAAGDWVRIKYDETTTGTWTRMAFSIDYILGYATGATPTAATGPA